MTVGKQLPHIKIQVTKTYSEFTSGNCRVEEHSSGRGGPFTSFVAELASEIVPVITAELAAAGHPDDHLAGRIARKIVLTQLDATGLDDREERRPRGQSWTISEPSSWTRGDSSS